METVAVIGVASIVMAGLAIAVGTIGPALGQAKALAKSLEAVAQQPDAANVISRNLFVGLAMIESLAIYCLVIAVILIFTNPFWNYAVAQAGK